MSRLIGYGLAQLVAWLVVGMVAAAWGWVRWGEQRRRMHTDRELAWLVWHWWTGGPLETDRAFPYDGARPWRHRARRAATAGARIGAAAAAVAGVCVTSGAPSIGSPRALAGWGLGVPAGLCMTAILVAHVAVRTAKYRQWVRPLHLAVHDAAGWDIDTRPGSYITIPRDRARGGDGVIVRCAATFAPRERQKAAVEEIVRSVVDLPDERVTWVTAGRHRYVQFRPQQPIPAVVRFAEYRELVEAESGPSTIVFGLGRGDKVVKRDIDKESPHILVSAGTGGGKTTILTAAAAQLMWHGADVTVLDIKRHSLRWLRDLPGVSYARDIAEIHRTLVEMAAEGDRRNRELDAVSFDQPDPGYRRHVLLFEEMSSTMDELRDHWTEVRESSDPRVSPAIRALARILNMGRAVRIHVLAVAQRADALSVGTGGMRENYAVRVLARYTPQTWKMLVPECEFRPKSNHPGRAQVCAGSTATETQVLWITETEAHAWVRDKRGMRPQPAGDAVAPTPVVLGKPTGHAAGASPAGLPAGVEPVTLWDASVDKGRGVVALTYNALRSAARPERAKGEFPAQIGHNGKGPLYDPRALQRWEANRPMAKPSDRQNNAGSAEQVPREGQSTTGTPRRAADRVRFDDKVDRGDGTGCWLWTGAVDRDGYGVFRADDRTVRAHRWAYEHEHGPIAEGLTIDHLTAPDGPCTSRRCVRPDHLEAVSHAENAARGHARRQAQGAQQ